jgi:hypothetical protein
MKMKVFGRTVPTIAIALVAMAALASAGLLSYYGKFTGTAHVTQSVKLSDYDANNNQIHEVDYLGSISFSDTVTAGDTLTNGKDGTTQIAYFKVKNYATSNPATVQIGLDQNEDNTIDSNLPDPAYDSISFVKYDSNTRACTDDLLGSPIDGKQGTQLTLNANGDEQLFCVKVKFKINAVPTDYQFKLTILPVSS